MPEAPLEPDGERWRRWAAGDRAAFEELVREWERPLGRFAFRLTGNADAAADIVQEVFLKLVRRGADYRDRGAFKSWLFRIAINAARDRARSRFRKPTVALEIEPLDDCEDDAASRERTRAIAEALNELPQNQRETVVLHHYEGLNFEAMARMLGIPASTLKSRFAAAMAKLEHALTTRGWKPETAP